MSDTQLPGDTELCRGWRVHGMVQGVGFRAWTRHKARGIGVAGWVRNVEDGTVEVAAAGTPEQINALESYLTRGPRQSRVTRLEMLPPAAGPLPAPFEIRR